MHVSVFAQTVDKWDRQAIFIYWVANMSQALCYYKRIISSPLGEPTR